MATLLYRLGRFSFRRPWRVLGVWLVLLVALLGGGLALGGQTQESYSIPGTESQQALDRLRAVFPAVAGAAVDVVVVSDGPRLTEDTPAIDRLITQLEEVDGVEAVVSPFSEWAGQAVTDDGRTAIVRVQLQGSSAEVSQTTLDALLATAPAAESAGLRVEFGGEVFQDTTVALTITEVFGVLFAGVVLVITFGSLLAAGMPLLGALVGVGIAMGGILAVAAISPISSTAPLLALMIGLAVGIDYALFILSRHRNQLATGHEPEESAGLAVGTAGSAVVFAGVTVIIALLGLLVVGIPFLSVMGVAAAFTVALAIAVAVTLLPALLGLAGARLAPKPGSRAWRRAQPPDATSRPALGQRWVRAVTRHPLLASLGVIAVLGTLAIPAASLDLNIPDGGSEPQGSTQRAAYELISEGFGPGHNGPLVIALDITQSVEILDDLDGIRNRLGQLDGVAYVSPGIPDEGLDTAIIQVIPETAPTATETKQLVQRLRELAPELEAQYGMPLWVTGTTAVGIDISNRLSDALVPFALVVVGLSILLLMMVFRSVLVPVKAALGFLLTVAAATGLIVAIFQWGWGAELLGVTDPGPILSFLPIVLMAVLFGLAMDYEVFLVSGMRESFVRTGDARRGIEEGFAGAARVVTAAALIMFFVFFAFVPEGSGMIKPIALGLAVGIAVDAFLVRMTLGPALMSLFGKAAWWLPAPLARLLPDVDIEGEQLREHREAVEWARAQRPAVLSAEELVAGTGQLQLEPVTLRADAGAMVLLRGEAASRRLLAATLSGRLEARAGRAQVAGRPLPEAANRIALAELTAVEPGLTAGAAIAARLTAAEPWYRPVSAWRLTAAVDRAGRAAGITLEPGTVLAALPPAERAIVLAAAALAERTPVVVLDAELAPDEASRLAEAVSALAPADTVIVLGVPELPTLPAAGRTVLTLEPATPARLEGLPR